MAGRSSLTRRARHGDWLVAIAYAGVMGLLFVFVADESHERYLVIGMGLSVLVAQTVRWLRHRRSKKLSATGTTTEALARRKTPALLIFAVLGVGNLFAALLMGHWLPVVVVMTCLFAGWGALVEPLPDQPGRLAATSDWDPPTDEGAERWGATPAPGPDGGGSPPPADRSPPHGWSHDPQRRPASSTSAPLHPGLVLTSALWTSPDGTVRKYSRESRLVLMALIVLMAVPLAVGPALGFLSDSALGGVYAVAVIVLGLVLAYRIQRQAIVVMPGRVTVRGIWISATVAASEVVRFEPPSPYGGLWRNGLRVVLLDGRVLYAGVFGKGPLDGAHVGVDESAELNEWLAEQRNGSPVDRF